MPSTRSRSGRRYQSSHIDHLTKIPTELLLGVARQLYPEDLCSLQLTCKVLEGIAVDLFGKKITRVYVSPCDESLQNFRQLCKDPQFVTTVTEVVFIRQCIDDQATASDLHTYACCKVQANAPGGTPKDPAEWERSFQIYRSLVPRHEINLQTAADLLERLLKRLPLVHRAVVATEIDQPGFNASSLYYSKGYAAANIGDRPHDLSPDAAARVAASAIWYFRRRRGTKFFLESLARSGLKITDLSLGNGTQDQLDYDLYEFDGVGEYEGISRSLLLSLAPSIQRLNLSCTDDFENSEPPSTDEDKNDLWTIFMRKLSNLRTLKIHTAVCQGDNSIHTQSAGRTVLRNVLLFQHFPKLRNLELIGQEDMPEPVHFGDMNDFISRHYSTLRSFKSSGILIMDMSEEFLSFAADMHNIIDMSEDCLSSAADMHDAVRSTLKLMRRLPVLESVRIDVYRRDEHAKRWCRKTICDGTCRQYYVWDLTWTDTAVLDDVAGRLQIDLKGNTWDFGKYVMRKKRNSNLLT